MSEQQIPAMPQHIYNQIMEMFRQADLQRQADQEKWAKQREEDRKEREAERQQRELQLEKERAQREEEHKKERKEQEAQWAKEREADLKKLNRSMAKLSDKIGEIVEAMVEGDIVGKFQELGYEFTQCARWVKFRNNKLKISREIDLFLEDGDLAMLIEVKTTLETADVQRHIGRLEEYRRYADAKQDKRRFLGAVAGAVVHGEAAELAHENGMYVIVQSGESVRITRPPENFQVREW